MDFVPNEGDSIYSGNFSVRGYLHLIWKDSVSHMHGLAAYMNEGLLFTWDLSLETSSGSYLCFQLALLTFLLFPLPTTFFVLYSVFNAISSNIYEFLLMNLSAKCLSLETLTFIIGTGQLFLVGMMGPVNWLSF